MVFFRQDLQAFGQQHQLFRPHGDFAGFGAEHRALYAHQVAHVQLFKLFIGFIPQAIPGDIALHLSGKIHHMAERSLAHDPLGHHAPGDGHRFLLQSVKIFFDIGAVVGHIVFGDLERIPARGLQFGQLFPADLQQFIQVLSLGGGGLVFIFCHIHLS